MQINFRAATYQLSAPSLKECPEDSGAEVAFAGRSNAGKSSAINTLTHNTKLARTSKTPGRTQMINFFRLSDEQRLVDLPGYGYAKVPLAMKKAWEKNLTHYLAERQSLKGIVLLMDARHPMQEFDAMMINSAVSRELPVHLVLTKSDKLKRGPASQTLLKVKQHMKDSGVDDLVSAQLFSSLKKTGIETLNEVLTDWLQVQNIATA